MPARSFGPVQGESTIQQLYDGAEFDAYRELGLSALGAALAAGLGEPVPPPEAQAAGA